MKTTRNIFAVSVFLSTLLLVFVATCAEKMRKTHPRSKPNVIIFNADDMGYGDLSSYGHPTQEWGPIDDLTREGMKLNNMYAAASMCSPSRAALLTGRLPVRSGVYGPTRVFIPTNINGLPKEEITIAEALKENGYHTGMVGKWHLGINAYNHTDGSHLPYNHGFDFVGHILPMTNLWECDDTQVHLPRPIDLLCMLYNNATNVQQPFSHKEMTSLFVEDAKKFMGTSEGPFFLYFALSQTHTSMDRIPGFVGSSRRGAYGDDMRAMAWAVGSVLDEVNNLGLDEDTLVIFTSDHGPQINYCNEGGDSGIFKGGKGQFWEGGVRIPAIVRWPGRIKPGSMSNEAVSHLDIFPTVLKLAGGIIPDDRLMDGQDISDILFNWKDEEQPQPMLDGTTSPDKTPQDASQRLFVFYCEETLFAVRYGSFKYHYYTQKPLTKEWQGEYCDGGFPLVSQFDGASCTDPQWVTQHISPLMYNVDQDPNEAYPLNTTLVANKIIMEEMLVAFKEFNSTLVIKPSLFLDVSQDVGPCCTPETFPVCTCNFP